MALVRVIVGVFPLKLTSTFNSVRNDSSMPGA